MEETLKDKKMVQQAVRQAHHPSNHPERSRGVHHPERSRRAHHPERSRRVAILIAFRDFQDEEYFIPKGVLETAGVELKTISTEVGKAIGSQGGEAEVDITFDEFKVSDFDAIVFIGGSGAPKYLDNETSYKIARETISEKKILAAICISPIILAKAGVLFEKKVTVWSSLLDKNPVKILKENGAIYQDKSVIVDGNIITGNGPDMAKEFGEAIVQLLTKK